MIIFRGALFDCRAPQAALPLISMSDSQRIGHAINLFLRARQLEMPGAIRLFGPTTKPWARDIMFDATLLAR